MNKSYSILVLTDHSRHSDQNSVYGIVRQMLDHPKSKKIFIASRGLEINKNFFDNYKPNELYGSRVTNDFQYTEDGKYLKKDLEKINIRSIDLVLLRLPRPISDKFLLWLESIFKNAVIINRPSGIVKTSSKAFLLEISGIKKQMKLCRSISDILEFATNFPIVLKPLREYGGKGILKIDGPSLDDGVEISNTTEYLEKIEKEIIEDGFLAMKFLKNVSQGDKRILVVGGEIMASSLRLPAENSWLCNVAQGGQAVFSEVDEEERSIIAIISPILESHGIVIFGADTLVDDDGKRTLSEVNTLSIGGFVQAEEQTGLPIIKNSIDKIFKYTDEQFQ